MGNPLLARSVADMTPDEESALRGEILSEFDDESLLELQKRSIGARGKKLALDTKTQNLDAVELINDKINGITEKLMKDELVNRVLAGIETGKDFGETVKAVAGLIAIRDRNLDKVVDEFPATGKKKRIVSQFKMQGVTITQGVEIDG